MWSKKFFVAFLIRHALNFFDVNSFEQRKSLKSWKNQSNICPSGSFFHSISDVLPELRVYEDHFNHTTCFWSSMFNPFLREHFCKFSYIAPCCTKWGSMWDSNLLTEAALSSTLPGDSMSLPGGAITTPANYTSLPLRPAIISSKHLFNPPLFPSYSSTQPWHTKTTQLGLVLALIWGRASLGVSMYRPQSFQALSSSL